MNITGPIELIKKSFGIFFKKENMVYFLKIYVLLLPFLYVNSFVSTRLTQFSQQNPANPLQFFGWLTLAMLVLGLVGLIISFWVNASGILAVSRVVEGLPLSFKGTLAATWKMLFKFSILDILIGLIVTVGFILLIVPGILFWVWFYFAGFELITKGTGVGQSLGNSKRLVSGRFWVVFGRLIIFGLFSALAGFLVSAVPYGVGGAITTLFGALFILPAFLLYKELSVQ
jgi:hypothetical protein